MKSIIILSFLFVIAQYSFSQDSIIDIHCHIKDFVMYATFEDYLEDDNAHKIHKVGGLHIAKKGEPEKTRKRNDDIIELSKKDQRIIPIGSAHPYDGDSAINELKRIKELGVKIIKLHPITQNFDVLDDRAVRLFFEAANLNLIILIDSYGIVKPGLIENLLRVAFIPNSRWIFAHMGGNDFMKFGGIQVVNEANNGALDNVYFDISAMVNVYSGSPMEDTWLWIMRSIGVDKILFGTDFPHFSLSETLDSFNKLDLTDEERNKILYLNAKNLLEL